MKSIYVSIVSLAFSTSALAAPLLASSAPNRLQLKIIKHQACTTTPTPSERIRFPSSDQAPLLADPKFSNGCYLVKLPITVQKSISGTVQIYAETRYGATSPIEQCNGADSSGYGGVGSCVYRGSYLSTDGVNIMTSGSVQLLSTTTELNLEKGVAARIYSDMQLSLCMPTKDDFLKAQGSNADSWNQSLAAGRMVFLTLYVFNTAVNALSSSDLQKIAVANGDQVIGCHKIVATVSNPST